LHCSLQYVTKRAEYAFIDVALIFFVTCMSVHGDSFYETTHGT
jgi:hypothetical protein